MALLLAFYQKMRLIREKNKLSLDLVSITGKKSRIEKNIKSREKFYTSIMENLKSQVNMMEHSFSMNLRNSKGLGCNDFGNIWSGNSISGFIIKDITAGLADEKNPLNKLGDANKLLSEYNNPNMPKDANGNIDYSQTVFKSKDNYDKFGQMISKAQTDQTQVANMVQWETDTYKNQLSVWLQAQEETIEAAKDEELDALSYKETMIDLDKTAIEQRLEEIKAEMQSYDSLLKEEAQNTAPKFGL